MGKVHAAKAWGTELDSPEPTENADEVVLASVKRTAPKVE